MISDRAASIFLEAKDLTGTARVEFLNERCGDSADLLRDVFALLAASDESEDYFDQLADKISLAAMADGIDGAPPEDTQVGSWRLVELIGRGGMGAVYLAERVDPQFEQRAALKLLPSGLDSAASRARFLTERQILARLSHDGIARLIDGGVTDEGRPYFVMD